jgi:hypothetical protein
MVAGCRLASAAVLAGELKDALIAHRPYPSLLLLQIKELEGQVHGMTGGAAGGSASGSDMAALERQNQELRDRVGVACVLVRYVVLYLLA